MTICSTIRSALAVGSLLLSGAFGPAYADFAEEFSAALYAGKTDESQSLARARLAEAPGDRQAGFALGTAQFFLAVEQLGQGLYTYGLGPEYNAGFSGLGLLPFVRLPVPPNPEPQQVTYDGLREVLAEFVENLSVAEASLAAVGDGPTDLPLDLGRILLDLNADGTGDESERLVLIFSAILGAGVQVEFGDVGVDFDESDIPWLRGYCHLLMSMGEFLLAHDWERPFQQTFHSLFPASELTSSPLLAGSEQGGYRSDFGAIADLVAFVHLFDWPVVEPERMASIRTHLLSMAQLSRENWRKILAETDDRREWVPGPSQTGWFGETATNDDVISGWYLFLDAFEAVLNGEMLIPHWRFADRGVNLRRMLEEPRRFDPVLIAQGSAVIPYLEEGPELSQEDVQRILNLMGGNFFLYLLWFN